MLVLPICSAVGSENESNTNPEYWINKAVASGDKGAHELQINSLSKAIELYNIAGDIDSSREALRLRAEAYLENGYNKCALYELEQLAASEVEEGESTIKILTSLSAAYLVAGIHEKSKENISSAISLARTNGELGLLASALQVRANIFSEKESVENRRSLYRKII